MVTKTKGFIPLESLVDHPEFGRNLEVEGLSAVKNASLFRPVLAVTVAEAQAGRKFKAGRKPGTAGAIRLAIAVVLKSSPGLTNAELWLRLKEKPPRGYEFRESTKLGKYIEGPTAGDDMQYRRFMNVAAEERGKPKLG